MIPLRPLGLGEILDGSVTVVRRYPKPVLSLSVVVAIVVTVLNIILVLSLPEDLLRSDVAAEELDDAEIGGGLLIVLGLITVNAVGSTILTGMMTAVVGRAVLGREIDTSQTLALVRKHLGRLLLLTATVFLLIGAAVVLPALTLLAGPIGIAFLLAGIVVAIWWYFLFALAAPALVLEECGVRTAIRRSIALAKNSFWRILGILLLAIVIGFVVSNVLQSPFLLIDGLTGDPTTAGQVGLQIGAGLGLLVTQPFISGVRVLLYIDRRMRAEGLDVTLATAAATRGPAA